MPFSRRSSQRKHRMNPGHLRLLHWQVGSLAPPGKPGRGYSPYQMPGTRREGQRAQTHPRGFLLLSPLGNSVHSNRPLCLGRFVLSLPLCGSGQRAGSLCPKADTGGPADSGHWPLLLTQPPTPSPSAHPGLFLLLPKLSPFQLQSLCFYYSLGLPSKHLSSCRAHLRAQVRRASLLCTCIHLHIPPSSNNSHHPV